MSSKSPSDLYVLIKSLSGSEKRYLHMKASFHQGEKQYLKLFSLLDAQKEYDPKKLSHDWEQLGMESSLAVTRNYLYEFLLNMLEQFHTKKGKKLAILTLLRQVDILFDKALYRQCGKLLRKARKLSIQVQSPRMQLEILIWEYRILLSPKYNGELKRTITDVLTEEARVIHDLSMVNKARSMRFKVEQGPLPELEEYYSWKKEFESGLPPGLICEYHRASALYLEASGSPLKAVEELKSELEILETNFDLATDKGYFSKYESCIETLIGMYHKMGNAEAAYECLQKIEPAKLPASFARTEHLLLKATVLYYTLLLRHSLLTHQKEELQKSLLEIETSAYLWKQDIRWYYIGPLLYSRAICYRFTDAHSQAIKTLRVFFSEALLLERERLFMDASWLFIILHYEKGNMETVETHLSAMKRKLRKSQNAEPMDNLLLKLFGSLINSNSTTEITHAFTQFKQNSSDAEAPGRKGLFNYSNWSSHFLGEGLKVGSEVML